MGPPRAGIFDDEIRDPKDRSAVGEQPVEHGTECHDDARLAEDADCPEMIVSGTSHISSPAAGAVTAEVVSGERKEAAWASN